VWHSCNLAWFKMGQAALRVAAVLTFLFVAGAVGAGGPPDPREHPPLEWDAACLSAGEFHPVACGRAWLSTLDELGPEARSLEGLLALQA
jgi:hypothetical protein